MAGRSGARRNMFRNHAKQSIRRFAMLKPILFAAATLMSAVTTSPLVAKPITPEVRIVSYADLDLSTVAGRTRLERRVQAAVRDVCGEAPSFDLARRHEVRECIAETRANVRSPAPAAAGLSGTR
jgi:UrcA family protein